MESTSATRGNAPREEIVTRSVTRREARQAVNAARNYGRDRGYRPSPEFVAARVQTIRHENDQRYLQNGGTVRVTAPSPEEIEQLLRIYQNR